MNLNLSKIALALAIQSCICQAAYSATAPHVPDPQVQSQFEEAMKTRDAGDVLASIEFFKALLSENQELHRVRLELALAYSRIGEYKKAIDETEKVLKVTSLPPQVRITVLAFLAKVKADKVAPPKKSSALLPYLSLGIINDDNVALVNSGERSDNGIELFAGVNHRLKLSQKLSSLPVYIDSGASVFSRSYFNDSDFNLDSVRIHGGPVISNSKQQFQVDLAAEHIRRGSDALVNFAGITPEFTWFIDKSELTLGFEWLNSNYVSTDYVGYDSHTRTLSLKYKRMMNEGKWSFSIKGQIFDENAETTIRSNNGRKYTGRLNWNAWQDSSIHLDLHHITKNYDGVETVLAETATRDDIENSIKLSFRHDFKESYLNNWRLTASYRRTDHNSDLTFYEYKRNVYQLTLSRSF